MSIFGRNSNITDINGFVRGGWGFVHAFSNLNLSFSNLASNVRCGCRGGGRGRGGGVMMMSFFRLSGTKQFTHKQRESLIYWYSIQ
jgi:hypothetical protein